MPGIVGPKLAISVLFDVVKIEVICGSEYEAQVFFDDLIERMRSGDGFSLEVSTPKRGRKWTSSL